MWYTPLPFEDVWGPLQERALAPLELVDAGDLMLLVRREADGSRRVERILSTNPRHFMDDRYQPGALF
ncbi:MAG: YlzJ-like family protein [Clostridia bacterium]